MLTLVGCLPAVPIQSGPYLENASIEKALGVLAHRQSRTMVTIVTMFSTAPSTTLSCLALGRLSSTLVKRLWKHTLWLPQEDKTLPWPHSAPEAVTMGQVDRGTYSVGLNTGSANHHQGCRTR